jgi:hypothetical protein
MTQNDQLFHGFSSLPGDSGEKVIRLAWPYFLKLDFSVPLQGDKGKKLVTPGEENENVLSQKPQKDGAFWHFEAGFIPSCGRR